MSVKEANTSILLSAIIPVGGFPNGDSVLKSWIETQLPSGLEVILVLDCEDEAVRKNLQDIVDLDTENKISLQVSHFRNPGSTREIGLKSAQGKWVCFWDADDLPDVKTIWRNILSTENETTDVIIGNYRTCNYESKIEKENRHTSSDKLMHIYLNPGLWRFIFKSRLISNAHFPPLRMGEDQVFLFRALEKTKRIEFSEDIFYNYYQYSEGQLTKSQNISTDLIAARNLCKELYASSHNHYLLAAIIKQNLTLIKRGILVVKVKSSLELMSIVCKSFYGLKTFLRVITMVLHEK